MLRVIRKKFQTLSASKQKQHCKQEKDCTKLDLIEDKDSVEPFAQNVILAYPSFNVSLRKIFCFFKLVGTSLH